MQSETAGRHAKAHPAWSRPWLWLVGLQVLLLLGVLIAPHRMMLLDVFFLPVALCALRWGAARTLAISLGSVVIVALCAVLNLDSFRGHSDASTVLAGLIIWGIFLILVGAVTGRLFDQRRILEQILRQARNSGLELLLSGTQPDETNAGRHPWRVGRLAEQISRALLLSDDTREVFRLAGLLHEMPAGAVAQILKLRAMYVRQPLPDPTVRLIQRALEVVADYNEHLPHKKNFTGEILSLQVLALADKLDCQLSQAGGFAQQHVERAVVAVRLGELGLFDKRLIRAMENAARQGHLALLPLAL